MSTRLSNTVTCTIDITELGRQFEQGIVNTMQNIASNILTEVVSRTPIDEGDAKSNWQVGINGAPTGIIPAYAPGSHGSTFSENVLQTLQVGRTQIARAVSHTDRINIVNNLPYIRRLNDGSSLQAPAGFVEDAVVIGIRSVAGARIIP